MTKKEIIKDLERTISMAENKFSTCVEYDLNPDAFTAWMYGWMLETIKITKQDLEQLQ